MAKAGSNSPRLSGVSVSRPLCFGTLDQRCTRGRGQGEQRIDHRRLQAGDHRILLRPDLDQLRIDRGPVRLGRGREDAEFLTERAEPREVALGVGPRRGNRRGDDGEVVRREPLFEPAEFETDVPFLGGGEAEKIGRDGADEESIEDERSGKADEQPRRACAGG